MNGNDINYASLEVHAALYVIDLFSSLRKTPYPYHNLKHTQAVVSHAKEIASFYSLNEVDTCIISLAAWFHDIGQLTGDMEGHEERSISIMNDCLRKTNAPPEILESAARCILATKHGSHAETLNEKIVFDADTYHFGTALFRQTEFLVKREVEMRTGREFPDWHAKSLHLLKTHSFYTDYCRRLLQAGKEENIAWLELLVQAGI